MSTQASTKKERNNHLELDIRYMINDIRDLCKLYKIKQSSLKQVKSINQDKIISKIKLPALSKRVSVRECGSFETPKNL